MMTIEENKEYAMHGKELKHYFKKTVGKLLMEERMNKNLHLNEVSQKTKLKPNRIEEVEFGRHKFRWCMAARLLRLYKKTLEINIIDMK